MNLHHSPTLPGRRRFATGLAAGAATLLLPALRAQAQSLTNVSGVWQLDGNGHTTPLELQQQANGSLSGSMYGASISGFFSPAQGVVVLLRGPANRPTQVFVGQLSQGGALLAGSLYALTAGMGGSPQRNRYAFVATRNRPPASAPGPGPGTPSFACLAPAFTVYNRPSQYPAWTFPLLLDSPGFLACIEGEVTGRIAGDPIYGHYASGDSSLVFMRMSGGMPAQFYVGHTRQVLLQQQLTGLFYALTPGMGAGVQQIEYDWAAYS